MWRATAAGVCKRRITNLSRNSFNMTAPRRIFGRPASMSDCQPSILFALFGNNSSSSLVYSSIGPLSVTERDAAASEFHRLPVL
jgi:hypothetical protein